MSSFYLTVGRHGSPFSVCPICGKPDWCCSYYGKYNDKDVLYHICNRYTGNGDVNGFKYLGTTGKNKLPLFVKDDGVIGINFNYSKPTLVKSVERFKDSKLDVLNRKLLSMLKLEDYHRKKLKEDGFTDELIELYGIKSFPPTDYDRKNNGVASINPKRSVLAKELLAYSNNDLTGFPGAYLREYEERFYWSLAGHEGILFPISNVYNEIVMLQVRLDNPKPNEGKYKVISSDGAKTDGTPFFPNGCGPSPRVGVIKPKIVQDSYVCYITEGIKKAIIASNILKSLFVTVQGVNNTADLFGINDKGVRNIDVLRSQFGVVLFVLMYDGDKYHNDAVQRAESNLSVALLQEGFKVATASWDSYMGKGIDDVFNSGYRFESIKLNMCYL